MGLKLKRKLGEQIAVSGPATITVEYIGRHFVSLDVTADAATKIDRPEWARRQSEAAVPPQHELGGEG